MSSHPGSMQPIAPTFSPNKKYRSPMTTKISDPLTLPCGATIPNRLAKAAMTEGLATPDGVPTAALEKLYSTWADGGAGLLVTGNIQIDYHHLERPGNVIIERTVDDTTKKAFQKWTKAATRNKNQFWAQLSHAGRQVPKVLHPSPKAPSAVALGIPGGRFGTPTPLTIEEIDTIVENFASAARFCQEAGFTGVQIHSAHGYLLSNFLSPRANVREDEYGGSLENRSKVLLRIIKAVRSQVGPKFPISVKLNSADFQRGGFQFEDSLQVAQWLEEAKVDLIEISGGVMEQAMFLNLPGLEGRDMPDTTKYQAPSTKAREAYFIQFAMAMKQKIKKTPLMVTGGFRTRAAMIWTLESGAANMIGLGRPLCVVTDAPNQLLREEKPLETLPSKENTLGLLPSQLAFLKQINLIKAVDAFAVVFWFYEQLVSIGKTGKPKEELTSFQALLAVDGREKQIVAGRSRQPPKAPSSGNVSVSSTVAVLAGAVAVGVGFYMMLR